MKLTSLNVENWKPSAARQEVLDRDGLYFIVQPSGVKSWALRYRRKSDGKPIKQPIGGYPRITLKAAGSAAPALRAEIERGADPTGTKIATRKQRAEGNDTFEAAARRYVTTYQYRRNKSWS